MTASCPENGPEAQCIIFCFLGSQKVNIGVPDDAHIGQNQATSRSRYGQTNGRGQTRPSKSSSIIDYWKEENTRRDALRKDRRFQKTIPCAEQYEYERILAEARKIISPPPPAMPLRDVASSNLTG